MKHARIVQSFCISLALFGSGHLNAADFVWQGASGGDWSVTDNWAGGEVPNAADAVVDLSAASGTYAIAIDTAVTVGKITLGDGATTSLTLSGATLTFAATETPEVFVGSGRTLLLPTATAGKQGLRKTGAGTFRPTALAAAKTFSGGITVEAGLVWPVKDGANNYWCGFADVRSGATFKFPTADTLASSFQLRANGGTVDFNGCTDYLGRMTFSDNGLIYKAPFTFIDDAAVGLITATGTGHSGLFNGAIGATSRYGASATKVSPYRTLQVNVASGADFAMTGQIVDNRLQASSYGNNLFHAETATDIPYAGQLQKVGAGDLVLYGESISLTGPTKVDAGRLILSNTVTMTASTIRLATGTSQLVLSKGSTLKIGGIACTVASDLDLGGNAVDLGGTAEDATLAGAVRNGTIRKVGSNVQAIGSLPEQANIDVLGGTLALGLPQPLVRYAFDDAANLGKDSGSLGKTLTVPKTGVTYASDGTSGGCATLNGSYLTAASAAGLPGGNSPCTLAAWIKPTAVAGVIAWGNAISGKHYYNGLLFNGQYQLKHTFWGGFDALSAAQTTSFQDGQWHHVAFTYEPSTRVETFYVDGVAAGTTTFAADVDVVTTNVLYVGSGIYAGTFKGKMDEVMVFDRALSADEIVRVRDWNAPVTTADFAAGGTVRVERDATLSLKRAKQSIASISGSGALAVAEDAEVTVTSDGAMSIGRLTGSGSLVKKGAGTLTLNQARDLGGKLDIAAGAVSAQAPRVDATLKAHLKAWWNFNDRENPGADASGNGLTVRSYVTPGTGNTSGETYPWRNRFTTTGGVAWFDGVNNHHLELVNSNDVSKLPCGGSSFTTACWFNPAAGCSTTGGLLYWGNGVCVSPTASKHCNGLRLASATTMTHYFWSADAVTSDLGDIRANDVPDGWHHVAVTYDGTTGTRIIYYDGVAKSTSTVTGVSVDAGEFRIGMTLGYQRGYQNFTGYLDDVMIFDTALTAAQVKSIMRGLADAPTGGCEVTVASGASFTAAEGAVGVDTVTGAGAVTIADGASLVVCGAFGSDFSGTLSSAGTLAVAAAGTLDCVGGTSRAVGGLALAEGATLAVSGASSSEACWSATGDVTLPATANVVVSLAAGEKNLRVKLFETSGTLTGSVAGWTTTFTVSGLTRQPKREASTYVEGNAVYASVRARGLVLILW